MLLLRVSISLRSASTENGTVTTDGFRHATVILLRLRYVRLHKRAKECRSSSQSSRPDTLTDDNQRPARLESATRKSIGFRAETKETCSSSANAVRSRLMGFKPILTGRGCVRDRTAP